MNAEYINAIGTWVAPALGLAVVALINWRAANQGAKMGIATIEAQKAASEAAEKAASAAERLIISARETNTTLTEIKTTTEKTHDLVNSSNTVLVKTIEVLTGRIAKENPDDVNAQIDAQKAREARVAKEASEAKILKRSN